MYIPGYISSNTCQIKDQFINMTKNAQVGPHQSVLCHQSFVYKSHGEFYFSTSCSGKPY